MVYVILIILDIVEHDVALSLGADSHGATVKIFFEIFGQRAVFIPVGFVHSLIDGSLEDMTVELELIYIIIVNLKN